MTFGERIKQARQKKRLTQRELASLIGAKHNSISNWENDQNKPDPDMIELLCGVLEITPSYLFGFEQLTVENNSLSQKSNEHLILYYYKMLNDSNKEKLLDSAREMVSSQNEEITKVDFTFLNAAHEIEGASEEDKKHDDDIMDDENF